MTDSSRKAFIEGRESRITHKDIIFRFLRENKSEKYTFKDVSKHTGLSEQTCIKRLSDLNREGFCAVAGKTDRYSLYQFANTVIKLTKTEAYNQAIKEFCPMFFDKIKNRVKELI